MVRSHPQHQCSSPVGCFFKFSARTSMDASGAELTAPVAASPGAAEHERDGGELEPVPATALEDLLVPPGFPHQYLQLEPFPEKFEGTDGRAVSS